eukprot:7830213-Alexandrium_andersonii.AAC.1
MVSEQRQPSKSALRQDGESRNRRLTTALDGLPGVPMTLQQASARCEHVAKWVCCDGRLRLTSPPA